jgi:hypothetical protein
MSQIAESIGRWWDRLRGRVPRIRVREVASMQGIPHPVPAEHLFLVGGRSSPKWAVLSCPCGCGERIDVNLMRTRRPTWTLTHRGRSVTLSPSLWLPEERCGSHFWLDDSRIRWVAAEADGDQA